MESNKNKITDVFGLAPYGDAIKLAVEKGFEGASALLSRICLPAAGELGLMYQDKLRHWRLKNLISILNKAEGKLLFDGKDLQIHPRVMHEIMEGGSWCEDSTMQDMWSGLLSISCETGQGSDNSLLFIQTLSKLTSIQAKIINHICENCKVRLHPNSLITGKIIILNLEELFFLTKCNDIQTLDTEMDNLRANDLISSLTGGFVAEENPLIAKLRPSAFLLHMFAKTQGFSGDVKDFYKERIVENDDDEDIMRVLSV
jgi:hypothetical protein